MIEIFQILLIESFWAASLRIATPLIFGVLGALICEKSGVLNLGIEGIFVAGAMAGWMAVWLAFCGFLARWRPPFRPPPRLIPLIRLGPYE